MRQSSGACGSGSSATITGGSSAWPNRSADSGNASASARVQRSVTRQLIVPPRHGEGDRDAKRRGGAQRAWRRGPPPPCFAWSPSPFRGGSFPRFLGQPLIQPLLQRRRIIAAATLIEQGLLAGHPVAHLAGRGV